MSIHKVGPLDRDEFLQLQELLRRFVSYHDFRGWKSEVYATQGLLRSEYDRLFVPKPEVPMTAGPNPIPVHELLNAETPYEQLSAFISQGNES
jgi:hypothetical protein